MMQSISISDRRSAGAPAIRAGAMALMLMLTPLAGHARQSADNGDAAWNRGDYVEAEREYAARLAADSADVRALHRLALILAWGEQYDRSVALFDQLVALRPNDVEAAIDRARVLAWRNDHRAAIQALDAVLAEQPDHLAALRARAQFQSWAGDLSAALDGYDRILELEPSDQDVRRRRAQVLSWDSRYDQAVSAYRAVLESDPHDQEARLGLAQVLSWGGRYEEATAVYEQVLAGDPQNRDAVRGLARVASWSGDLRNGESMWRHALDHDPADVEALVGLSQTLRWQGRYAEARAAQRRAGAVDPDNRDLRNEMRWTRAALAPRFSPSYVLESDSDGNRITTSALVLAAHLTPHLELRGDFYYRELGQRHIPGIDRATRGGQGTLTLRTGPGWTLSAGGGASAGAGEDALASYRAAVHSPPREFQAGLDYSRRRLDATAQLADNRIEVEELALTARAGSSRAWMLETRLSAADFIGEERNRRIYGRSELGHPIGRDLRVAGLVTLFTFRDQLTEGYFNPDFYGLAELSTRWSRDLGAWHLMLEAAPGLQQVGTDGSDKGAFRAFGRIAYTVAPGRQIGIAAAHSSNGLQRFATSAADYRYRALIISGGWAF